MLTQQPHDQECMGKAPLDPVITIISLTQVKGRELKRNTIYTNTHKDNEDTKSNVLLKQHRKKNILDLLNTFTMQVMVRESWLHL